MVLLYNCFHLLDALSSYPLMALKTHMSFIPYSQPITVAAAKALLFSKMYPFSFGLQIPIPEHSSNSNPRTFRLEPRLLLGPEVLSLSTINIWGLNHSLLGGAVLCTLGDSSISGLYPLDACSTNHCPPPQVVTTKMSPGGKTAPAEALL